MLKTPVLLVVFNRPDTTRQVLDALRQVQPRRLFVAADGPREGVAGDGALCAAARSVATTLDWECDVQTLFREENLGCGLGPSSAISWFFDNVAAGILLEDDCVPDPTFFRFCGELLEYYCAVPEIMQISGSNFLEGKRRGKASYYYSRYPHCSGGWATWRRAWQHFDYEAIPDAYRKHIWDGQWRIAFERNRGLSVAPNSNLVTNIGFGRADATHTKLMDARCAGLRCEPMTFPLVHPARIRRMDRYTDFTPSNPQDRTYLGAPFRFARLRYRKGRKRVASFVKRRFVE